MGITGLWDVLGPGTVTHIASYAAAHFAAHHRPLRIAVDEACWRYTNLTAEQVARIRAGEPAANPVEKVILYRMLRLLRLNVQLLFVYDGLRKPGKARRQGAPGGGKLDDALIALLHRLLDRLGVPYHRAPGEAEAECARLQRAGAVDAVWSDDGDSFMFGATTLLKAHRDESGKRVADYVRVYHAEEIRRTLGLDASSMVLFALLAGGDYEATGLKGCGPQMARRLAHTDLGLAAALVDVSQQGLPAWRAKLQAALHAEGRYLDVPATFPSWKALQGYRAPAVSTDEQLHHLRGLRGGWDKRIDQPRLRTELRQRYNFQLREYLKHVAPVFLARALARCEDDVQRRSNLALKVQLKSTRRKKGEDAADDDGAKEVKVLFAPAALLEGIDLRVMPADGDWSKFAKGGMPWDPMQPVECEILECFLRHGLPEGALLEPVKKKSKAAEATGTYTTGTGIDHADGINAVPRAENASKKRGRPPNAATKVALPSTLSGSNPSAATAADDLEPRPVFKRLKLPTFTTPSLPVGAPLTPRPDDSRQVDVVHSPLAHHSVTKSSSSAAPAHRAYPTPPLPQSILDAECAARMFSPGERISHFAPRTFSPGERISHFAPRTFSPGERISHSAPRTFSPGERISHSAPRTFSPGEVISPEALRQLRMAAFAGPATTTPTRPTDHSRKVETPFGSGVDIIDLT